MNLSHLLLVADRVGIETDELFFLKLRAYEGAALEMIYRKAEK